MAPTLIVRSASPGDLYEGFKVDECWSCPAPWEDKPLYWDKHEEPYRERFYFGFPISAAAVATLESRERESLLGPRKNEIFVLMACGRRYFSERQAMFERDTVVVCKEWTEHNGLPV